jgi:ATP-dependent RNA helicase DDX5/DBP2
VVAFAMGKEARKAEKELAQQFKANLKLGTQGMVTQVGGGAAAVKVDDKYAYMATAASLSSAATAGNADAAWDD